MADKLVALEPIKAEFCHLMCRSLRAKRVVEVGASFGVSTLYLAAAVRANADNTEQAARGYEAFFAFVNDPANGLTTMTLPFEGGLEMVVKG